MRKKLLLICTCLFACISIAMAQVSTVTGVVTSEEDNLPIVGASVLIKGTNTGTVTDIDGKFTLGNIPADAKKVIISFIGMRSRELDIKPVLNVILQSDTEVLDEVVVTGYGVTKKSTFTAGHLYGKNDEYKMFSKPNIQAATPTYWLRASEVYFLRAEAALIWGGEFGNAEDLYKQGIEMSFQENGISSAVDAYMNSGKTPIKHEVGGSYSCSFAAPCTTTVKFEGNTEQKLEKIMIQKWIALFPNGQEAWTEWRRTGYPKLNPVMANRGSSQGVTAEGGIRRMIYPISFYQTADGQKIYNEAVKMLSNGQDLPSTHLWWDCK